ncbi:biopolymer transporter ExbD [Megasphaera paucivorans]|uniref:Biopolymer transport protein ExbD n=1 Tax=Megasphaera paucivorans TaxID=349095 RepID=A0A1H0AQ50_9FIRM|nr:biopolymer transporter ExbD [Megasphaera paucivorans]SDN35650.1 biopolymer transport protein ExbD [Megasphaera paucivorans]
MKLQHRHSFIKPKIMIIPMIDIMFFLLVFFMLSTLYMQNITTVPIQLPKTAYAETQKIPPYLITLKADGSLWLKDTPLSEKTLISLIKSDRNLNKSVILRADSSLSYDKIMGLLNDFKSAGIYSIGLASEKK